MKKTLLNLITFLLISSGLVLLAYPFVANYYTNMISAKSVSAYEQKVNSYDQEQLAKEVEKATIYDDNLIGQPLHDPFTPGAGHVLPDNYVNVLNVNNDGVMGSIVIPKIGVNLPIYHGVGEDSLQRGAGHIEYTSTPYGGIGRHSFISAHRGLPNALMFTDLNQLTQGDLFLIKVLGETHAYKVTEVSVIKPEDFTSTNPEVDKDRVTLITCTPYGVNTERLLVTGDRVPYTEDVENNAVQTTSKGYFEILYASLMTLVVLIVAYAVFFKVHRIRQGSRHA